MLFSVVLSLLCPAALAAPEVIIGRMTLIGRDITGLQQDFFGGIPFVEPPLGKLRLTPPVRLKELPAGDFNATNFGLACLQPNVSSALMSEDCLTINVLRPSGLKPDAKVPVLFWTYGGGFQGGSSAQYNASAIVAQSVARGTPLIYVNFNYRLGPLGFPQGDEANSLGALNLALKDQLAALEWVQENIHYFGGDKSKVTVFGESAGSIMTAILFLNSHIDKLARAAIFESGMAASTLTFDAARREIDWENFVAGVASCTNTVHSNNTFSCLKNANSSDILTGLLAAIREAPEQFAFPPTIDGQNGLYPDISSRLLSKGGFARLPFIAGTNMDEGTIFTPINIASERAVRDSIIANFTPQICAPTGLVDAADKLIQLYPNVPALGSPYNTGNQTFGLSSVFKQTAAIGGDISFQSQRRYWSQQASKYGVKTYAYLFTQPQPTNPPAFGVSHGSEIRFVYGAPPDNSTSATTLSRIMIDYWVSFATSLDPNDGRGIQRPHWGQYTTNQQVVMQLNGDDLKMIPDDYRATQIDFINSIPAILHHRR